MILFLMMDPVMLDGPRQTEMHGPRLFFAATISLGDLALRKQATLFMSHN